LIGEIALTAEPTAQPLAGAACKTGMLKRPKNKAIKYSLHRAASLWTSTEGRGVREIEHPTASQISGHSARTTILQSFVFFKCGDGKAGPNIIETASPDSP
jgi:hypothetical protein